MPAGLQIFNEAGVLIVSDLHKNYHLIEKGTFVIPAGGGAAGGSFTFTRSGRTLPVIAIRAPALVGSGEQVVSGGTLTRIFSAPTSAASVTVEFWLFDVVTTSSPFGLEVYNSSGQLTYSSGVAPMRVAGEVVMTGFTNTSGTFGAGRTYASVQTFSGFAQENTEFVPDFFITKRLVGMASWSGTTITCRRNFTNTKIQEFDEDIPGFTYEFQAPRWLIVDVTNL